MPQNNTGFNKSPIENNLRQPVSNIAEFSKFNKRPNDFGPVIGGTTLGINNNNANNLMTGSTGADKAGSSIQEKKSVLTNSTTGSKR